MMNKKVAVYRREHFNAAHRLHNAAWDESKNDAVFGKCNNPNYHGHNYEMEVRVAGAPAADTGFVVDLKLLSDTIKEHIIEKLDHKNLNLDVPEFATVNPTVENIVIVIYQILREKIDKDLDLQVRLYETPRNFAEYPVS
jgi:6-pyruvoyltetrahydropterin/6-carboxytetrahydropterin synthase